MSAQSKKVIFQGELARVVDYNSNFRELEIVVKPNAGDFRFRCGQFVMLHVPQENKPALRAYSVASDDRIANRFTLLFKKVPNGLASSYVWNLKQQDLIQFTGPFGRLFFQEPPTEQIIMLNTGSGIAQHICYLKSKADLFPEVKYKLLFGLNSESDLYFEHELMALKKKLKNFDYSYVLSNPSKDWAGKKGYVQNHIAEYNYHQIPTTFYLCGNPNMIKDTKQKLIEAEKFDANKIHSEAFS